MKVVRMEIAKAMVASLQEGGIKPLMRQVTTERESALLRGVYEMLWKLETMLENHSFETEPAEEKVEA